jgi:hypothetical protein
MVDVKCYFVTEPVVVFDMKGIRAMASADDENLRITFIVSRKQGCKNWIRASHFWTKSTIY